MYVKKKRLNIGVNLKEIKTIKALAEYIGKSEATVHNWKKTNPELHEIIMKFLEEDKTYHDLNNPDYLKKEMIKAIDTLPQTKVKKFYHLMMAELAEIGH